MSYRVELMPSALADLRRLPPQVRKRVARVVDRLADDPMPRGSIALKGADAGLRRLRIGAYRAAYTVDREARVATVWRIGHRSTFYRRMIG